MDSNLQFLAPVGVMMLTLAGLLVYAGQQGVSAAQLSSRDLDEESARQLAGPRVVGSLAIILLIVFKWMNSQLFLMTFVAMPLILLALVWHTLLMIRIRKAEAERAAHKKMPNKKTPKKKKTQKP